MTRRVSHEDLDALLVLYSAPPARKRAHAVYAADLALDLRDAHARIAALEAELAEARRITEAERQGWKVALRTLINEPQHAAIIGNPASAARAEIDEIGAALVALAEARKDGERLDYLIARTTWTDGQKARGIRVVLDERMSLARGTR